MRPFSKSHKVSKRFIKTNRNITYFEGPGPSIFGPVGSKLEKSVKVLLYHFGNLLYKFGNGITGCYTILEMPYCQ